jgi:hypothetical protein
MSVNPNGTPENLVPSHKGNLSALRHGAYSRTNRVLAPRAEALAEGLRDLPQVSPGDALAVEEVASLLALAEAIDADIAARGVTGRRGDVRKLIDVRVRVSRRLMEWSNAFALTPASRAALLTDTLAAEIAARRAETGE